MVAKKPKTVKIAGVEMEVRSNAEIEKEIAKGEMMYVAGRVKDIGMRPHVPSAVRVCHCCREQVYVDVKAPRVPDHCLICVQCAMELAKKQKAKGIEE